MAPHVVNVNDRPDIEAIIERPGHGAGTLTYVEAGTVYGYTVLEDATILIVFDARPMVSEYAAARGAY